MEVTSPPLKVNFCPTGVKSKLKSETLYNVSLVMFMTLEYVSVAPWLSVTVKVTVLGPGSKNASGLLSQTVFSILPSSSVL